MMGIRCRLGRRIQKEGGIEFKFHYLHLSIGLVFCLRGKTLESLSEEEDDPGWERCVVLLQRGDKRIIWDRPEGGDLSLFSQTEKERG